MSRTYEISFKLGAQMAGNFAKTMTSASGALGQLSGRMNEIGKERSGIQRLISLRDTVKSTFAEYKTAQHRADQLRKVMEATGTKEAARDFEQAQKAADRLKQKFDSQKQSLSQMNREMGTASTRTSDLQKRADQLAKASERAASAQKNLQDAVAARDANIAKRGELRGQLFDAVGLAATLAVPVKIAAGFEQAMAKVGAVSRASDDELKALTATARQLGATTNWSASDAAAGMEYLAMAGFNTNQTIAAMPGMLNLASAGAVDLGSAADIASNILSGFSMEAEQMGKLGDVLTNTFTSSNTNLNMLGETMKYVAPVASATGVSLEQAAAMAGKLGDAGIQGSQAGTSLRSVINRLAAPSGKAAEALANLGIQTQDAEGNMRDVPTILAEMDRAMQGMGSAARQEMTSAVFGMEAASAATILLGQAGSGNLQKYAESLAEAGSAARVAGKQNETAQGAMKRLASAGESIAITIGNVLLPPVATFAELLARGVGVVDSLAQRFPVLTKVLVIGTAALIALKIAAIAGGYAFTFIKGAWLSGVVALRTVQAALAIARLNLIGFSTAQVAAAAKTKIVTAAQWLWNAAMTANPIGLIVAGIAALIAAGVALYRNWDKVTAFFTGAWNRIKELFLTFHPLGWMMGGFDRLNNFLSQFSLYNSGKAMLQTLANGIKAAVGAPVAAIKGALQKVRNFLPFSDAKTGPLSQLTASGQAIMDTLGHGMDKAGASPVTKPLARNTGGMLSSAGSGLVGGSMSINITQQITVGGGAGADVYNQARAGASEGAQDLIQQLQSAMNRERRLSYA